MAVNEAFDSETKEMEHVIDPPITKTAAILRTDEPQAEQSSCCSWNGLIDIFGNRQGNFITELRPLRMQLTWTQQQITIFTTEIENSNENSELIGVTMNSVHSAILSLTKITVSAVLTVPPEENAMLRKLACDLCKLYSILSSFVEDPEQRSSILGNEMNNTLGEHHRSATERRMFDKNGLRERLNRNSENIEKVIKFIDVKTERRWWLRDLINFLKLFLKLALFVSAAITVIDHEKDIAPITTLSLTIIQGIIDMLDQYFLKHTKPEDLKVSAISAIAFHRRMSQLA